MLLQAKKILSKTLPYKQLLFASALTLSLINKSNINAQTLINSNQNNNSEYAKTSFITRAIENRLSVVTIETVY